MTSGGHHITGAIPLPAVLAGRQVLGWKVCDKNKSFPPCHGLLGHRRGEISKPWTNKLLHGASLCCWRPPKANLKGSLLLALVCAERGNWQGWVSVEPSGGSSHGEHFPIFLVPTHAVLHNSISLSPPGPFHPPSVLLHPTPFQLPAPLQHPSPFPRSSRARLIRTRCFQGRFPFSQGVSTSWGTRGGTAAWPCPRTNPGLCGVNQGEEGALLFPSCSLLAPQLLHPS